MIEWSDRNKYNSFNSYKGLLYMDHYQKIAGWLEGRNQLPGSIEASLDPVSACNSLCYYCNSQRYLREYPAGLQKWDKQFIRSTLNYLSAEGTRAFCWGGGGEALLNNNIRGMTKYGTDMGMECSIITNGVLLDDEFIDELLLCRWIGISLDSADPEVYKRVRGIDDCKKVLSNISRLIKKRTKTDITIKVLVLPETIDTLIYTCKVAKDLGVQSIHIRPVDLERKDFKVGRKLNLDVEKIRDIFSKCHELETNDFQVFTVQHKYNESFHVMHNFSRCLASPLVKQICTDKKLYICLDHRLEEKFQIKEWGSEQHRNLLKDIEPDRDCGRCTFGEYNRQMAECVLEDSMCRNFP